MHTHITENTTNSPERNLRSPVRQRNRQAMFTDFNTWRVLSLPKLTNNSNEIPTKMPIVFFLIENDKQILKSVRKYESSKKAKRIFKRKNWD